MAQESVEITVPCKKCGQENGFFVPVTDSGTFSPELLADEIGVESLISEYIRRLKVLRKAGRKLRVKRIYGGKLSNDDIQK